MKLLVIGGTRFVGRHFVEAALGAGHEITLFHRGRSNPGLFEVEEILGDRESDLARLSGRQWDAVVDTCGYFPRLVEASAKALRESSLYTFVSTISVYAESPDPTPESGSLLRFKGAPPEEVVTAESYGPFKVLCEEAATEVFGPDRTLILRPGLIVGPHDPTDRFTYWVDRFMDDEPVLIPDRGSQAIQFIDARDLAALFVTLIETGETGIFNATGPEVPTTMEKVWVACRNHAGGDGRPVTVADDFLAENGVRYWQDLPFVVPPSETFPIADTTRARAKGLTFRSLAQTISDTAAWRRDIGRPPLVTGLDRARERALIAKAAGPK